MNVPSIPLLICFSDSENDPSTFSSHEGVKVPASLLSIVQFKGKVIEEGQMSHSKLVFYLFYLFYKILHPRVSCRVKVSASLLSIVQFKGKVIEEGQMSHSKLVFYLFHLFYKILHPRVSCGVKISASLLSIVQFKGKVIEEGQMSHCTHVSHALIQEFLSGGCRPN